MDHGIRINRAGRVENHTADNFLKHPSTTQTWKCTCEANLLICPNLDSANILFNVLKMTAGNGVKLGPILLGAAASAHILTPSATVRRVVNMTALAVANGATFA